MDQSIQRRASGEIQQTVTQSYSSQAVSVRDESAVEAAAAEARALIEARFVMAMRRPRDIESFRAALLKEAARPTLAAVAIYRKPVGKRDGKMQFAEGLSVHFIRTAKSLFRNLHVDNAVTFENSQFRKIRVTVLDAEAGCTESTELVIEKAVERRYADGREILGERENSNGDKVYIVKSTEDELLVKQRAMIAKAERTMTEHLLPRDIMDEARAHIEAVQKKADSTDPDKAKRTIIDAFAQIDISPTDLAAYIGHTLDRISPAELTELRGVYSTVKNGEGSWNDIMRAKDTVPDPELQKEIADKLKKAADDALAARKQPNVSDPQSPNYEPSDEDRAAAAKLVAESEKKRKGI